MERFLKTRSKHIYIKKWYYGELISKMNKFFIEGFHRHEPQILLQRHPDGLEEGRAKSVKDLPRSSNMTFRSPLEASVAGCCN